MREVVKKENVAFIAGLDKVGALIAIILPKEIKSSNKQSSTDFFIISKVAKN
jgi:hypothetical protein